jgi:tRNA (guanine-N7-)-methyltransferase
MRRELKEYANIELKSEKLDAKIDFTGIFGRRTAVHVEIGSGKGTFLVHQARAHPDVNFLGIEWARKYYRYAVDRIGRWGLQNVRILRADAATFLRDFVHEESVDCFHIYFPDPWPKKRHHKRRLLQSSNVDMLIQCLKPSGEIRIATDHEEYFAQIKDVASTYRTKLQEIEFERPAGAEAGEMTGTNYERKYVKEDRLIYTIALRRIE